MSRANLFDDAMEELTLTAIEDVSIPLEVNFSGEAAHDYGGPRKECTKSMYMQSKQGGCERHIPLMLCERRLENTESRRI